MPVCMSDPSGCIRTTLARSLQYLRPLIIPLLLLPPFPGMADDTATTSIEPFDTTFTVGNNLITAGTATLSLRNEGDDWVYSIETKPSGLFRLAGKGHISEVSVLEMHHADGELTVMPKRYSFRQDEEKRRAVDAWFDWDKNEIMHRYRGKETVETLAEPLVDRLSATLIVMDRLRTGFDEMRLPVFANGRVRTVVFVNEGTTSLSTPFGEVEAIKIRNFSEGSGRRQTITWFAPSLDYAPVRIEQLKRDELVVRFTLKKLNNRATREN